MQDLVIPPRLSLAMLKGIIQGWTSAPTAGSPTTKIDIAAGGGADTTGAAFLTGGALTKQIGVAWAAGNDQGSLDSGVIGNADYWGHAIRKDADGTVDYITSLSRTAPTLPGGYTYFRPILWFRRTAGVLVNFKTFELEGGGLRYLWDASKTDGNNVTLNLAFAALTLSVPVGLVVKAFGAAAASVGTGGYNLSIRNPGTTGPAATIGTGGSGTWVYGQWAEHTNTSAQIEWAGSINGLGGNYIYTDGFEWSRR